MPETMPMPEHDAIPVGKVDLSSSEDIEKAINSFILQGGKIRRYSRQRFGDGPGPPPEVFDL